MNGQFQSSLDGFSAAVRKVGARRPLDRDNLIELFRQVGHQRVVVVSATDVNQLCGLVLNRSHNFRMAVAR
jgi:hypothetical protein